jgi:hypothetical protein
MSKIRYLAAFGAAGLVFTAVFGAAAALQVEGGAIQAGQDGNLACDTKGVTVVSYGYESDDATSRYARVTGINSNCAGHELFVDVFDGSTPLTGGSLELTTDNVGDGEVIVDWAQPVPARDINRVQVAIEASDG